MERRKYLASLLSFIGGILVKPVNILCKTGHETSEINPAEIDKVHVIFKTHLDVGFTDLAENVINRYFEHFIPTSLSLAEELRKNNHPERFIWTTGSWLIYEYLNRASAKNRTRMEEAIVAGDIAWHALPFTTHSELMDNSLFSLAPGVSAELDKRFGKKTIAAKMTDVPGHSIGIVPPLQKAGISFLHIGINPASTPPDVPPLFVWRAPDGSEIVMMYQMDYGSVMVLPGTKTAVSISFTGDNNGPQTLDAIKQIFSDLQLKFPNALIKASTLNDVAKEVNEIRNGLPVITQELGDTWIHGVVSDPWKIARFRELCRLRRNWIKSGKFQFGDPIDLKFGIPLMMVAEHTWGLDVKSHLKDWDIYNVDDLAKARSNPNFKQMEESWREKRSYLDNAISNLPKECKQQVNKSFAKLEPQLPQMDGFQKLNPEDITNNIETANFAISLDPHTGAINQLIEKKTKRDWAGPNNPLALFTYQTFSKADYDRFQDQYLTQKPDWSIKDFGKPGIENINPPSKLWLPVMKEAWINKDKQGLCLLTKSEVLDKNGETPGGCPQLLVTKLFFPDDASTIHIDFQWFNKQANRLPEALWFSFVPKIENSKNWLLDKMGVQVNPLNVIKNGNRKLHGVIKDVSYKDNNGDFYIETLDCPLAAPGERSLLDFNNNQPKTENGMHFNLYNNVWGTNFVMWFDNDMRYRFNVKIS